MNSVKSDKNKVAKPAKIEHRNVKAMKERKYGCKTHGIENLLEDYATGDVICTKCAVVVEERMITDEAEWRCFEGDTQGDKWAKSRAGDAENPFLSADYNLGTTIKMINKNQTGSNTYSANIHQQYKRRSVDKAISNGFMEINTIGDRLSLPSSVLSRAKALYSNLYRKINYKGNILTIDSKTAACVYIACKEEHCYRSAQEIAATYAVSKSALTSAVKRALDALDKKMPVSQGNEMIDRFCAYLMVSKKERHKSWTIANQIENLKMKTKLRPEDIAATAILLARISSHGMIWFLFSFNILISFSPHSNDIGIKTFVFNSTFLEINSNLVLKHSH